MYKVQLFNNIADEGLKRLSEAGVELVTQSGDAILLRSHKLLTDEFEESLKVIARAGAGTNNIPIDEATSRGIVVMNTPGANANAVKELVVCGMLLASRGIIQGINFLNNSKIDSSLDLHQSMESTKKDFKGSELQGKTLGIIGLGAIGSQLAQAAHALGMKLIGYDPYISIDAAWRLPKEVEKADTLELLIKNSDFISIHVPLTEETKDFINNNQLAFFKKGATLINLARHGIVNEITVIKALQDKKLHRYVTDFPSPALIQQNIAEDNVILLPHLGASTEEAEINCATMAATQIVNFLKEGTIKNSVNFPDIYLEPSTGNRLIVINKNEPGMIGKIADRIGSLNLNINDMSNKSRGDIAINLIDIDGVITDECLNDLKNIEHVISARKCNV
ncbi:MAG: 3-phosphoglycerate dehydrogenase family protein [Gammaproteobacteria bacterium]